MSKWEVVKLGEVFLDIKNGASIKQSNEAQGIPITRIETISNGNVNFSKMGYANIFDDKFSAFYLKTGDILMSHINSEKHLGKVALFQENTQYKSIIHGMNLLCLKHSKSIDSKYAFSFFNSQLFKKQILQITKKSVNQASFTTTDLKSLQIPLPPLDVQKKIADELDKINLLITKRKEQLEKLDLLVKAKFVEMFGDPVTNPMGWEVKPVIDYCTCMVPGRDKPKSFSGNIPWITIDDLEVNGYTKESKKRLGLTQEEIDEVKRKVIPSGSIIMSCVGNLGICSIAGNELIINQQLHSFQVKTGLNNVFLMHYLGKQKDYMNSQASSTTVSYMNKAVCNSIPTMRPPLTLQNEFANYVEKVEALKQKMQTGLIALEMLYKERMQEYFMN